MIINGNQLFLPNLNYIGTYIKFNDDYYLEEYVKYCNSRRKYSLLVQFRMGILPLAAETDRFKGINVNQRYL